MFCFTNVCSSTLMSVDGQFRQRFNEHFRCGRSTVQALQVGFRRTDELFRPRVEFFKDVLWIKMKIHIKYINKVFECQARNVIKFFFIPHLFLVTFKANFVDVKAHG